MADKLVIVESPAKASTIGSYLGEGYRVEACVGHIRDLPDRKSQISSEKKKAAGGEFGVDLSNGFEPIYIVTEKARPHVKRLKPLAKDAPILYLATDQDREGEAIAWHLLEVLKPKGEVYRLVFPEITRRAVTEALESPRELDEALVKAQETRRILDRLFGYSLSPVLWRKVARGLSAGRVQSVALRLVVERERERMAFVSSDWWDVKATLASDGFEWEGRLARLGGRRVAQGRDFDPDTGRLKGSVDESDVVHVDEGLAKAVAESVEGGSGAVSLVERKPFTQRPAPPFITSSLQQEANRRMRWPARRTMSAAQALYEQGWITYHRTDSTTLSGDGVDAIRRHIAEEHGQEYLPDAPRTYKGRSKGAQEAHEAIRPAGDRIRAPREARGAVGEDAARLYELIWLRTVACQMTDARGFQMTVEVEFPIEDGPATFRSTGRSFEFLGFRKVYVEAGKGAKAETEDNVLPELADDSRAAVSSPSAEADGHTTTPPARLTDASLIREMEARGIGRPSTFAGIIQKIVSVGYVSRRGTALVPTFTALSVIRLLEQFFGGLVDYDFTANMEEGLDSIATGDRDLVTYLDAFYHGEPGGDEGLEQLVSAALAEADAREMCTVPLGEDDRGPVVVRVGKHGPYLQQGDETRNIPAELAPDELGLEKALEILAEEKDRPRELGVDPESGLMVSVLKGRFGPYVQLGESGSGKKKPKTSSLLEGMDLATIDLETALRLLSLPRELGETEAGDKITASNGRYGPYIRAGKETRSIPKEISVLEISLEEALDLLAKPKTRRGSAAVLRELGKDGDDRELVVKSGRYGPYVTDGEVNASLPKGTDPAEFSLDAAMELLAQKRASGGGKKRRKRKK